MLVSGWVDPPSWSSVAFESGWVPPPKRPLHWNRPSCVQQGLPALRSSSLWHPHQRRLRRPATRHPPRLQSPQLYHPLVYRG
ncbi:hypothetical protein M885DRAFT_537598 [Pelagophyceae sp. CCMP2097]|nr:hypothetical protein M885DRAFT_537598 [Pelagophyceae sp. CCMP2097]